MYAGKIVESGPVGQCWTPAHPTRGLLDSLPGAIQPGERLRQISGMAPSLSNRPAGAPLRPAAHRPSPSAAPANQAHHRGCAPTAALPPLLPWTAAWAPPLLPSLNCATSTGASPKAGPDRARAGLAGKAPNLRTVHAVNGVSCPSRRARCWPWWADRAAASPRWAAWWQPAPPTEGELLYRGASVAGLNHCR